MLDRFCRDVRAYLEEELSSGRMYVTIRISRLVDRCGLTPQCLGAYAAYLRRLLGGKYRVARGVYRLSREDALSIYNNLDKLCEELKTRRKTETRRGMALVSFHVPADMLKLLDETARAMGINRSELVRDAIRKLLERMSERHCITLTLEEWSILMELVQRGVYASIEDAIHDAVYQLAHRRSA
jgi:Arc/MetJ-type ribon-helix-helix transcriptional regulator